MIEETIKQRTFFNMIWRFAERCGAQGVSFIVTLVLARLLAPDVYGTVALVTIITTILQVFVDSGLGNALIQKKNVDDLDFSSVFYFNIFICSLLYIGMFFLAPFIAEFYEIPTLTLLVRVISLILIISGVKNVQQAYVSRNLLFRRFFYATLGGTIFSAVLGVFLAYKEYGVWALVAQQLSNAIIDTSILWMTVKWRPKKMFSIKRLKRLFNFGWKLLVSTLLDTIYNNVRQLIIGKMYSELDLAFYNKGKQFPNLIVTNINTSIDSVLLTIMSREQDRADNVKKITRRAIRTSTYIMAPLMMGLAFTAPVVVKWLLTEKWLPCVPYLRIFCITYMFYPIHTANLNAINAMGRSDLFLKLEIIKKIYGLAILLVTIWFGPLMMAYSLILSSIISQIVNSWPNRKLLGYKYSEQLKDIFPGILLAVFMGICISFLQYLPLHELIILVLQILIGIFIYVGGSVILKLDSFQYLWNILRTALIKFMKNNSKD